MNKVRALIYRNLVFVTQQLQTHTKNWFAEKYTAHSVINCSWHKSQLFFRSLIFQVWDQEIKQAWTFFCLLSKSKCRGWSKLMYPLFFFPSSYNWKQSGLRRGKYLQTLNLWLHTDEQTDPWLDAETRYETSKFIKKANQLSMTSQSLGLLFYGLGSKWRFFYQNKVQFLVDHIQQLIRNRIHLYSKN